MPAMWALCKGFDTFGPIGPCIVTDVDPRAGLEIESFVNGERKQHSNTRNLIFDPIHHTYRKLGDIVGNAFEDGAMLK